MPNFHNQVVDMHVLARRWTGKEAKVLPVGVHPVTDHASLSERCTTGEEAKVAGRPKFRPAANNPKGRSIDRGDKASCCVCLPAEAAHEGEQDHSPRQLRSLLPAGKTYIDEALANYVVLVYHPQYSTYVHLHM